MKLNPSAAFITQGAHFLLGYGCVLTAYVAGGWMGAKYGAVGFWFYSVVKEAIWDPNVEDGNPLVWEGLKDLVSLVGGTVAALGLLKVFP